MEIAQFIRSLPKSEDGNVSISPDELAEELRIWLAHQTRGVQYGNGNVQYNGF